METPTRQNRRAAFRRAAPYADDLLNLPTGDLEQSIPYYEHTFHMRLVSRSDAPHKSAVLERDGIQFGFAENGGDPGNEGAFIEVDGIEDAFRELRGQEPQAKDIPVQNVNGIPHRAFFVVAPDGLCYLIAEPVE